MRAVERVRPQPSLRDSRILVISLQGIGNTALLLPFITALGRRSDCRVDVAISNNGSHALLEEHPFIGRVYVWDERRGAWGNLIALGRALRQTEYALAYAASPSFSRGSAAILLSRARRKKGYACAGSDLLDRVACTLAGITAEEPTGRHDSTRNSQLFGLNGEDLEGAVPCIFFSQREVEDTALLVAKARGGTSGPLIGVHPGSKHYKRWAVANFAVLAVLLRQQCPSARFLIFGDRTEADLMRRLHSRLADCAVMAEGLTIRQAAALIGHCDLFIGNDSSPMHLAAIQSVPTIGVFGLSDYRRIAPVGPKSIVIRKDYSCGPCADMARGGYDTCNYGLKCLDYMSPAEVFDVAGRYLQLIMEGGKTARNAQLSCGRRCRLEVLETGTLVCHLAG